MKDRAVRFLDFLEQAGAREEDVVVAMATLATVVLTTDEEFESYLEGNGASVFRALAELVSAGLDTSSEV